MAGAATVRRVLGLLGAFFRIRSVFHTSMFFKIFSYIRCVFIDFSIYFHILDVFSYVLQNSFIY